MPKKLNAPSPVTDCKLCYSLKIENEKLQKRLNENVKPKKVLTDEEKAVRQKAKDQLILDKKLEKERIDKINNENIKLKAELLNRFGVSF